MAVKARIPVFRKIRYNNGNEYEKGAEFQCFKG